MKSKSADKIKMPSIDELLGVSGEESATDIEISRIHSFANHPFKVLDDDKMDDLVESIKQNGVLTPVLVRPDKNNSYEMISGHRRMHAAIKAGLETIPAIVRDMEDDEAIVIMVDANIQREESCNLACWVRYHKYDLEESLEEMIDQQPHAAKYIIAMNILMDDAEGSESPFEGNSFMTS